MSNSTELAPWKRLIRFRGEDGAEHYGEPQIDSPADLDPTKNGGLKAEILEGQNAFELKTTGKVVAVKEILHILDAKDVPTIRCIGLNYKAHSKYNDHIRDSQMLKEYSRGSRTQAATISITFHQAQHLRCRLERGRPRPKSSPRRAVRL